MKGCPAVSFRQFTTGGYGIIASTAAVVFVALVVALTPNGRYVVKNDYRDPKNCGDQAPPCTTLDLVDMRTGKSTPLYKYQRWVRVLWSASSKAVIVNDYGGSDYSLCILFLLSPGLKKIDLGARLLA